MKIDMQQIEVTLLGEKILADVTFSKATDESVLLVGENGAGKTSLLNVIAGYVLPSSGKLFLNGVDAASMGSGQWKSHWRRIAVIRHEPIFLEEMTVIENVMLPLQLLGVKAVDAMPRAMRLMARIGASHVRDKHPSQLSAGERKLADLARALLAEPEMVLADEPFVNLDHQAKSTFVMELKKFATDGRSVIISTHTDEQALGLENERRIEIRSGRLLGS